MCSGFGNQVQTTQIPMENRSLFPLSILGRNLPFVSFGEMTVTGSEISSGIVGGPGMLPIMRAPFAAVDAKWTQGKFPALFRWCHDIQACDGIVFMPNYFILLTIKIENASKVCIGARRVQQRP